MRAILACVVVFLASAASAAAAAPVLSPAPGTPDANAATQISILGVPPGRIGSVRVVGSETGVHAGQLETYSHDRGASFLPDAPFAAGERVAVTVPLRGQLTRRWSFDVARPTSAPPVLTLTSQQPDKLEHFASAPDVLAPKLTVRRAGGAASALFLTPLPSPVVHPGSTQSISITPVGPGGPMIADRKGQLVWFRPLAPPDVAANLRVQRYRGRRVLTWWQGPVTAAAYGLGEGVIADDRYRTIRTVRAGNGYRMDLHELTLTPQGTALFTVYAPVTTADGTQVLDAIVQEVDVATGLVVWEWHALGHVPLRESYATAGNSAYYDAFHINSVQARPHGRVLVSMRDTSAVYLVQRAGGRIRWTLGGRASDFRIGRDAGFWLQHDAQLHRGGLLTVFDDEAGPPRKRSRSRGLLLDLDLRHRRATLVRSLDRPGRTSAQSEGSVQRLADGWLVGFGAEGWFSEFDRNGALRFDARLPVDDGSYRVYRFPWHARPTGRPAVQADAVGGGIDVRASFNGATEVARWRVLAGPDAQHLAPVATAARSGFETKVHVPAAAVVAARALDRRGRTLATSAPVVVP